MDIEPCLRQKNKMELSMRFVLAVILNLRTGHFCIMAFPLKKVTVNVRSEIAHANISDLRTFCIAINYSGHG